MVTAAAGATGLATVDVAANVLKAQVMLLPNVLIVGMNREVVFWLLCENDLDDNMIRR